MINTPFTLPCGLTLNNRLVKSAMTERISGKNFEPTPELFTIYKKWGQSGAGLLITGNVMIDRWHLESSGNVLFNHSAQLPAIKRWADIGKEYGTKIIVQISHAGRQTNRFVNKNPKAPSAVQLKKGGLFGKPQQMSLKEIEDVITGFVNAAKLANEAGFAGVQIHSAHGYLLSQFLSPRTNKRKDQWGGSLENRSRLLRTIIQKIREVTGPDFAVAVKLNSSDFQRGGFTEDDSFAVVKMLNEENIDLLEISGGTYEQLEFFLQNEEIRKESTKKREAYFIDFAKKLRTTYSIPLLVTGGFRSYAFCNDVLEKNELDLVGMARPFITNLNEIPGFISGEVKQLENLVIRTGIKMLDDSAEGGYYARQIIRMAKSKPFKKELNSLISAFFLILYENWQALRKRNTKTT